MDKVRKAGFPFVGALFLGIGLVKFLQGDDWVVWLILGMLFGGLGIFRSKKDGEQ